MGFLQGRSETNSWISRLFLPFLGQARADYRSDEHESVLRERRTGEIRMQIHQARHERVKPGTYLFNLTVVFIFNEYMSTFSSKWKR